MESIIQNLLERRRWLFVIAAFVLMFCLGHIYTWSAYTSSLKDLNGPYQFTLKEMSLIFSAGIFTFTLVMIMAGKLLTKIGPFKQTLLTALAMGGAYVCAGLYGSDFFRQFVFVGVMGGGAIGIGYIIAQSVGLKWFPDMKGTIMGLCASGFGFGAAGWIQLASNTKYEYLGWIYNQSVMGLPGVQTTYLLFGIIFFVLIVLSSVLMVNPKEGWLPKGYVIPEAEKVPSMTPKEMIRSWQFKQVVSVFFFSALAGLMVIYSIKLFGRQVLTNLGVADVLSLAATVTAGSALAIANGFGRIFLGWLSDKLGIKKTIMLMTFIQGLTMLSSYHILLFFGYENGLIVLAILVGFNFGGNFALMPTWTTHLFGPDHFPKNYPWVFTAYGVAGIAGPFLAGWFGDLASSSNIIMYWMVPYLAAGLMNLSATFITSKVEKPSREVELRPVLDTV